jgi:hypothetical protein
MAAIVRAGADLSWFTGELQADLLDALASGLKPKWVALYCGVAPKALGSILDLGSRRDASEPFKGFVRRWTRAEAELMREKVEEWRAGSFTAHQFLQQRWPKVWGKDAEPDYEPLAATASNAEELAQFERIVEDPAAFGPEVVEIFRKHGRLRPDES